MGVSEIRRVGIDVPNDVWDLAIYGDPSVAPGFSIGRGSRAAQFDSTPVGVVWYKFGPGNTDWSLAFIDGTTRTIAVADLPDIAGLVSARIATLLDNPLLAEAGGHAGPLLGLGQVADQQFSLRSGGAG